MITGRYRQRLTEQTSTETKGEHDAFTWWAVTEVRGETIVERLGLAMKSATSGETKSTRGKVDTSARLTDLRKRHIKAVRGLASASGQSGNVNENHLNTFQLEGGRETPPGARRMNTSSFTID